MALKFLNSGGSGSVDAAVQALNYATQMGAKISSNSWGGGGYSQAMVDAIQAADNAGALFIAAAGNNGCNCGMFPAAYNLPNIISVAATDHNDALATFSNYDAAAVDLGAPGVSILSTVPGSGYASYSGTSMATPHVAGAAALLKSAAPYKTWQQIKDQILASTDPIPALAGKTVSGGRLNVQRMLGGLNFTMVFTPSNLTVVAGNSVNYTVTITSQNNFGGTLNLSLVSPDSGITGVIANPSVTLPTGGSVSTSIAVMTAASVMQGNYRLTLNAIDQQGVPSSNDFTLTVIPEVDLVMTAVGTTATIIPVGTSATVSTTLLNQGVAAATAGSTVGIYLSPDATISTADTLIGTRTVASLAAGANSTGDSSVTIPVALEPGIYYLGAIADKDNWQPEVVETNNALAGAAVTLTTPDVDLVMTQISTTATFLPIGGAIYGGYAVKNQGTAATAVSFNVGVYLSTDATITTADILIGSRPITDILAGGASGGDQLINTWIPENLPPGTYYLGVIADYDGAQPETIKTNNALTGVALPAVSNVDLVMTQMSTTATSLFTGAVLPFTSTVKNQGTTPTTVNSYINFYLSTDATITTADRGIGFAWMDRLEGGASTPTGTYATIPTDLATGTYYLGAIADIYNNEPETNETNNALAGTAITVVNDVDLVMTAVSTTATSLPVNGTATVSTTVKNQGSSPTAEYGIFNVSIYLSTDATITTADTWIGGRINLSGGMAAGASSTGSSTVTIPANLAPGTYYLGTIADENNAVVETVETNNALAGAAIAVVSNVDLVMTAISTSAPSMSAGGGATVSTTIKNQGSAATALTSQVGFYLSTDATITTADTLIGYRVVSSLAAGASSAADISVILPVTLEFGTYYLGAIADHANQQPESVETNNALAGATVVVNSVTGVDMLMTAVSTTAASLPVNGTVTVSSTIKNQGTLQVGYPRVGIYLSTDATITAADTLIGTWQVFGYLNGGTSASGNTSVTVPSNLAPGTYYLGAVANYDNYNGETNYTNNALTGAAMTVVRDVDLVMTSVTSTSTSLPAGGTGTFKNSVRNQGTTPAAGFSVGIYLSTDATITTADTLIATRSVSSLAAGATSSTPRYGTNYVIPSGLPPGTYYLGTIADRANVQPETNETNNALAGTVVTITP